MTGDEQLIRAGAALEDRFGRHCEEMIERMGTCTWATSSTVGTEVARSLKLAKE